MGEGESKIAEIILQKQSRRQNIVIIHNLHISPQFYTFLSKTLQQFQIKKPHKNFRLILISNINSCFQIQISSSCHKYLINQPKGIQNQMKFLYQSIPVELTHTQHKKIAYSLCLFHSVVNQLLKYNNQGWNMPYQFTSGDFINSVKVLKDIVQTANNIKNYQCNIDQEDLIIFNKQQNSNRQYLLLSNHPQLLNQQSQSNYIDFKAIQYLIGEVNYVGKLTNDFDRQKMRLFIERFFNKQILKVLNIIYAIPENNLQFYGLQQDLKPYSQTIQSILINLSKCYSNHQKQSHINNKLFIQELLPEIEHPFAYINKQIQTCNEFIIKNNNNLLNNQEINKIGNNNLLKSITPETKIFDLRAFSNPHQLFIETKKQVADKYQIQYQNIELQWSLTPKQNGQSYGIKNLKLQGATIYKKQSGCFLDLGSQQLNVTLYFYAQQIKKKINDNLPVKKIVQIPLYMEQQRQGDINSYGDNINLLTMVTFQSNQNQQVWVLRSTALIANPKS